MKRFLFVLVTAMGSVPACTSNPGLGDLEWLEGKWNRTNARKDRTAYEQWSRQASGDLKGIGVSIQGRDTIFVERLRIIERNDTLFYVADVPENQEPVYFAITELGDTSFTCENPQHDFPKKIRYTLTDGILTSTISGDGKSQIFMFEKE